MPQSYIQPKMSLYEFETGAPSSRRIALQIVLVFVRLSLAALQGLTVMGSGPGTMPSN